MYIKATPAPETLTDVIQLIAICNIFTNSIYRILGITA